MTLPLNPPSIYFKQPIRLLRHTGSLQTTNPWSYRISSRAFSDSLTNHTQLGGFIPPVVDGFSGAVGNTPLIRLKSLCEQTGCDILGKAEFQNPGGSVKDRAALAIVLDAERKAQLKPGGTIVEGSAGNTSIGLAHIGLARGYRCIFYLPNTQSQEKIDLLKMLGAEVHAVPAVPFEDPQNYNHQAARRAESMDNAVWTNQFDNISNRAAHLETTGPEIWKQTLALGGLDGFICATGTGGTLAGVTRYLKTVSDGKVQCYLADPPGSVLHSFIQSGGELMKREGTSITEGIGQGRITNNLKPEIESNLIDDSISISDEESIIMVYRMLDEEGLYIGASSALNLVGSIKMSEKIGRGTRIVTILCDNANKYQSRLFSKKWLKSKKLFDCIPNHLKKYVTLD